MPVFYEFSERIDYFRHLWTLRSVCTQFLFVLNEAMQSHATSADMLKPVLIVSIFLILAGARSELLQKIEYSRLFVHCTDLTSWLHLRWLAQPSAADHPPLQA